MYNDTSNNPNKANRTISFVANDGTLPSNTATKTVTVTPVNDTLVVATSAGNTDLTGEAGAVPVDSGVTVSDVDGANLASATVTITDVVSDEDVLAFTNADGINGSYNATTGTLTLSGSSSV